MSGAAGNGTLGFLHTKSVVPIVKAGLRVTRDKRDVSRSRPFEGESIVFARPRVGKRNFSRTTTVRNAFPGRHSLLGLHLRRFHLESSALPRATKSSMITCEPGRMSRWSADALLVPRALRHRLFTCPRGSADLLKISESWLVLFAFSVSTKRPSWRLLASF